LKFFVYNKVINTIFVICGFVICRYPNN